MSSYLNINIEEYTGWNRVGKHLTHALRLKSRTKNQLSFKTQIPHSFFMAALPRDIHPYLKNEYE